MQNSTYLRSNVRSDGSPEGLFKSGLLLPVCHRHGRRCQDHKAMPRR